MNDQMTEYKNFGAGWVDATDVSELVEVLGIDFIDAISILVAREFEN